RQDIEQKLMSKGSSQYKVVCSTNALGMGIDKPDVRFVIHYHIPASPIHYYQEMGRAGRDRKVAWCILLYDPADITIQEHFIRNARPEGKQYDMLLALLQKNPQGLRESSIMLTTGFSQKAIRTILADLEEQRFIEHNLKSRIYTAVSRLGQMDFSAY
ncbi:MAG TPA: RecQ family ATP-dependent DNA helicase, partial [Ktedonobacter sp.]|nr:RecQ family ATP-dependent DNA helicase [Ktedonobacter sp.]